MYSERFDPAPPPSRENSARFPYALPTQREIKIYIIKREREKL